MLHRSLTLKLLGAFLVVSLIGIVGVALLAGRITVRAFDLYFLEQARQNFMATTTNYYRQTGSWQGLNEFLRQQNRQPPPPPQAGASSPPPVTPPPFILVDQNGQLVVPGIAYRPGDRLPETLLARGTPLEIDGRVVGAILDPDEDLVRNPAEAEFLARINRTLLYAALGAAAIALLLGILLARALTRPLRELTAATQAIAQGHLQQSVPVRSEDELGQLAAAFNQMSDDLARANQLRRQMTADIAHDLRSPLAVIAGYIESLRDGVLQPNPEMFDTLHTEAQHLQHLVEDLRTLSLADANELPLQRQPVRVVNLLNRPALAYRTQAEQQQITLQVEANDSWPEINIDPERMAQVLSNLVSNALRYTPAGGKITLSAQTQNGAVTLMVQDTGSGIHPQDLPHIFDRFYRADTSRQQNEGESGLGLAIARAIVQAHGGEIFVESEVNWGTTFKVVLPLTAVTPTNHSSSEKA